ncbi:MAG TPA: hypothetical protein VIJ20_13240, partial [Solirubrobacteraceae bacterium]
MSIEDPPLRGPSPGELKTILGVTASVVGLVGYLYLVGWIVDLVRFAAARLPAGATAAALSNRELFGDGLRSTLLMAVVFAVSCAIAYRSSARNWDVHGQDWHDIMRKGGVAQAASETDGDERRRRERQHARKTAERADRVARMPLGPVARLARLFRTRAGRKAETGPPGEPEPLEPAPLGDWAVRIIAGFNIMVLSALIAIGVVRVVGALVPSPIARWVAVVIGLIVFWIVRWALTHASPLLL